MGNEMFQARIPDGLADEVHEYREKRHMSKSEVVRHCLREVAMPTEDEEPIDEEAAEEAAEPPEVATDGGYLRQEEHPWVGPIVRSGHTASFLGVVILLLALFTQSVIVTATQTGASIPQWVLNITGSLVAHLVVAGTAAIIVAIAGLGVLEWLMHPTEAPIRRYFPRTWPEDTAQEVDA
jgi:hypothetical protein